MDSFYDWWAVLIFGAVSITWLGRSVNRTTFRDPVLPYAICALACALGNWLGNEGYKLAGGAVLVMAMATYLGAIRPFRKC